MTIVNESVCDKKEFYDKNLKHAINTILKNIKPFIGSKFFGEENKAMALDALNKRKYIKKFKQYIKIKQNIMIILNKCKCVKIDNKGSMLHHRIYVTKNGLYIQESKPPAGIDYEIFVREGNVDGFINFWVKKKNGLFKKIEIFNDDDWMDRLEASVPKPKKNSP